MYPVSSCGLRGTVAIAVFLLCDLHVELRRTRFAMGLCGLEGAAGRSHTLLSIVMQKFSSRKSGKSGTTMSTLCDVWYK